MHIGYNVLYMISDIYQGVYKSNQTNFYKISRKLQDTFYHTVTAPGTC